MKKCCFTKDGAEIEGYAPDNGSKTLLIILDARNTAPEIFSALLERNTACLSVLAADWNRDYSPWPAPRVFASEDDFSGKAADFQKILVNDIIPRAVSDLGLQSPQIKIIGVSLAGLFVCMQAWQGMPILTGIASISGSLWYDGFITWLQRTEKTINPLLNAVYLSVGTKEKRTRCIRMQSIQKDTVETSELMRNAGFNVKLELLPGGHFDFHTERILAAADYLLHTPAEHLNLK